MYEYDWDWESADKAFKRAIELSPNYPTAHQWYSEFLTSQQRFKEAMAETQRAKELDPLSPIIGVELARSYSFAGDHEKCIQLCLEILELAPDFYPAHISILWSYVAKGMNKEAFEESVKISTLLGASSDEIARMKSYYVQSGMKGLDLWRIEVFKRNSKTRYVDPILFAQTYYRIGEKEATLDWLEKAYEEHSAELVFLNVYPFDSIKNEERFITLLKKMRLDK